jgi:hypothetical protein
MIMADCLQLAGRAGQEDCPMIQTIRPARTIADDAFVAVRSEMVRGRRRIA